MCQWTATAQANATPEQLLEILTHPEEIRRWSPVDFRVADLAGRRLAAGTRTRVTGRLAGVSVTFDVEVHAADAAHGTRGGQRCGDAAVGGSAGRRDRANRPGRRIRAVRRGLTVRHP